MSIEKFPTENSLALWTVAIEQKLNKTLLNVYVKQKHVKPKIIYVLKTVQYLK